ncbi:peptide/nickel transport system permease protein [Bacillus sp. SORGH_AS 510]|uniref:ABC transporter permease subunit n=1 Tax=Bacillus sp. SORGH_AS_0510 TaxID=3041771 RepID=UPI0027820ED8|nr:ABC transporter permease subunit [Bacillus sp. SORGH_AS_0510]MDQ1145644.1 peptide/nickel transport system permease protein [Bacillus sp. SORGH_AS_0510]
MKLKTLTKDVVMKGLRIIKRLFFLMIQCFVGVEVLIIISVFPELFKNLTFNGTKFLQAAYDLNVKLFTFGDFMLRDQKNSVFPVIFYKYFDSMKMLALSFVVACVIAFIIAYVGLIFFKNKIKYIKSFLEILESIPDLMLILLLQFAVIMVYKKTGIKLARVVTLSEEAILLPVISLSVPISLYITKVLIHYIEEELEKHYVMLAKAKGFTFSYILNVHVLRNIADGMFGTSKTIFWSMLSTLFVIDYLFNMNGLLRVMLTATDPFIIGCILIFIPFFLIYRIYEWVSFDSRKDTQ